MTGLDLHKMPITATMPQPLHATCEFSALPSGLRELTGWLLGHSVTAAAMDGRGTLWKAPFEALEEASLQVDLFHAQHVKQVRGRKTDKNDSIWLARACQ